MIFNINIYSKYKVNVICKYSIRKQIDFDNIIFEKNSDRYSNEWNGCELLNIIGSRLKEDYISEFKIDGNKIIFEYFNHNNGESQTITYTIKERKISK